MSEPHSGSRHDFSIFHKGVDKYKSFLEKIPGDYMPEDPDRGQTRWAFLVGKGYARAEAYVRLLS